MIFFGAPAASETLMAAVFFFFFDPNRAVTSWLLQQSSALLFTRPLSHLPQMEWPTSGSSRMRRVFGGGGGTPAGEFWPPNLRVFMQTRELAVFVGGFSLLSPSRTGLCTGELEILDLWGFICERGISPPLPVLLRPPLLQVPFSLSGPVCVLAR